jgi:acyl carrier protein
MIEHWHRLIILNDASPDGLAAEVRVAPDSPWFGGHFPGRPILPGIAILSMVAEMVRHAGLRRERPVRISGMRRVRFRQPVRPDERLSIEISRENAEKERGYLFRAMIGNDVVCTGLVSVEPVAVNARDFLNRSGGKQSMSVPVEQGALIRRIAEIIITELRLEEVTVDTFDPELDLVDELGIDSMDLATIALVLQDEYNVMIDEDDYPKLRNIRLIAEYIAGRK